MSEPVTTSDAAPPAQTSVESAPSACPYDSASCVVAAALGDKSAALELLRDQLPCLRCRAPTFLATQLVRVRLGRTERSLLLAAPGPDADGLVVATDSRSTTVARQRASEHLSRAGLVFRWSERMPRPLRAVGRGHADRSVVKITRTPFGDALVARYRRELERGDRLRWGNGALEAAQSASWPVDQLIEQFAKNVRWMIDNATALNQFEALGLSYGAPDIRARLQTSITERARRIEGGREALGLLERRRSLVALPVTVAPPADP